MYNSASLPHANMEQASGNASLAAQKMQGLNPPFNILIHSIRKRLCDTDGISAKAAIDGLVKAGIFADDSTKYIKKISFSQEKGAEEKTIFEITEA